MTSLDFLKALLVPGCLISLIKRKLNIWTPYGMSFSITAAKTPFSSSPLISLRRESMKGVSYTRTDISAGGDRFLGISTEVRWSLVTGCFRGCPRPRFIGGGIVGSAGSAGPRVSSEVGRGASSSSSSSLRVVSDRKYGFTDVLLKLVGP
jgi:hypothetical protein